MEAYYKSIPDNSEGKISFMDDHQALKMLFHDWSNNPLFFENKKAQEKILKWQLKAIDNMVSIKPSKNELMKIPSIMSDFLIESGLYDEVMKTLGMGKAIN